MKRRPFLFTLGSLLVPWRKSRAESVLPKIKVTLPEAHKGTLEVDTRLLDSYGGPPSNYRQFYFDARAVFDSNRAADFTDPKIIEAASKHQVPLMGGPMLGDLRSDSVTLWVRPASPSPIQVTVADQSYSLDSPKPGVVARLELSGLNPDTLYSYRMESAGTPLASGQFKTALSSQSRGHFRIAFGSCCHKIGIHNPNLYQQILDRDPHLMMFLGDIAVDDRNDQVNMHRADYQLRDVSEPWRHFVANVPAYAAWDDHDYFDNDLSGIPRRFQAADRDNVRKVWLENWNNPPTDDNREGIYFNTRVGPVEIIMLDTRSCRDNASRNQLGSYLGHDQMKWLKQTLLNSTAPFKVLSSGTMWSDYVSNAKDSWGSWDKQGREELFSFIEDHKIGGVLLVSGDRHGARGFRIPRPSGFSFYEFEPATLGGVSGPGGLVKNCPEQLFGYSGRDPQGDDFVAFGEFTFNTNDPKPTVTFRLIDQHGNLKEEIPLSLDQLTPGQR